MQKEINWFEPVVTMFLAMASTLSADQQQEIQRNLRGLAVLFGERGDGLTSGFCEYLAEGELPMPPQAAESQTANVIHLAKYR